MSICVIEPVACEMSNIMRDVQALAAVDPESPSLAHREAINSMQGVVDAVSP